MRRCPAGWRNALVLALATPALGGCAAAAIPLVAGGLVAKDRVLGGGKDDSRQAAPPIADAPDRVPVFAPGTEPKSSLAPTAATLGDIAPVPAPQPSPPALPTAIAPAPVRAPAAGKHRRGKHRAGSDVVQLTELTALPPPSATGATGGDAYAAMAKYALLQAPPPAPGKARHSAIVDPASITGSAKTLDCADQPPAVLIDLDPGKGVLDLNDPPHPAEGLAAALASLRAVGVTVLWISALPNSGADRLHTLLTATLLDPTGADKLLLLSGKSDSKQQQRMAALKQWCIVAIAGDRRGDFDELYDYLKDPNAPSISMLEPMMGSGWFLAPLPID